MRVRMGCKGALPQSGMCVTLSGRLHYISLWGTHAILGLIFHGASNYLEHSSKHRNNDLTAWEPRGTIAGSDSFVQAPVVHVCFAAVLGRKTF